MGEAVERLIETAEERWKAGWEAGPRLIFTPADGLHSNADAEATTDGAFRADPFSAGSRWVREVARIEVVHG